VGGQEDKPTDAQLQEAVKEISQTAEGQVFFRALAHRCFFQRSVISGNPESHDINIYGTLFNEAARRLYLEIRRHIPPSILRKIETPIPKDKKGE